MTTPRVRIVANYQLMSDDEGRMWMTETLREARERGDITDFEVIGSWPGVYGIQLVVFTVDVTLDGGRFKPEYTYDKTKEVASDLLNGPVVPDSDVEVMFISPNPPAHERYRGYDLASNWDRRTTDIWHDGEVVDTKRGEGHLGEAKAEVDGWLNAR